MKRINYFYLIMAAIICAVVLRAQSDRPKQVTTYDNPIVHTTIGKIVVDTPKKAFKTSVKPKPDTLKIPAYTFTIPATEFQKMADTSYMVMQNYGIEMTGSQIRTSQDMVSRQWQRLFFNYARPDTIRVVKGK